MKTRVGVWTFPCTKRVPLAREHEDGMKESGFTTVPDGSVTCEFEIEVDEEKLVNMIGKRAAFSKSGVTKLQGGAVTVRVVKKTKNLRGGFPGAS